MKYLFRINRFRQDIEPDLPRLLPGNITYSVAKEGASLSLKTAGELSPERAKYLVERECDRIGFLTGDFVTPVLTTVEHPTHMERTVSHSADALLSESPDASVIEQVWGDSTITIQLRLWRLAKEQERLARLRIILLFQIVELVMPVTRDGKDYPPYSDTTRPPDPRTEAKLLRDLASHQDPRGPSSEALRRYCNWILIPEKFPDPTDVDSWRKLSGRIPVLEKLARSMISQRISRRETA
jgi:hypothetical protein